MENTELNKKMETLGVLETAILSAHLKFFKGTTEVRYHIEGEEYVLYNTVIKYLTGNS
ncbi:MAG: hypothetical protein ABFD82_15345 [Syntrophaceae bacterium]